jgi:predicted lipoprotein with Yx(FWY)xxD motif
MTRRVDTMTRAAHNAPEGQGGTAWRTVVPRAAGAGLLIATGAIHLDLYLTGYRSIPTIGWLFLLQVIAAFALALGVLILREWLVAAAGAAFAVATLGGYLLSIWIGLFGFKEVRTTAGIVAGAIEIAAFAVLTMLALAGASTASGRIATVTTRTLRLPAASLVVIALALLAISVAGAGGAAPARAGGALRTRQIGGVMVLTDAKGYTLYWFAPDTPTTSKCYGTCAQYWPPLTGRPAAGPGVTGRLATIKRSNGSTQVTYDGHPLYTYVGDTAPGQAHGNNLNLNGGLWHEAAVSGS